MGRATILVFLILPIALEFIRTDWREMPINRRRWMSYSTDTKLLLLACIVTCVVWLTSCALSLDLLKSLSTWARTLALVFMAYLLTKSLAYDRQLHTVALKALVAASSVVMCIAVFTLYFDEFLFNAYRAIKGEDTIALQTFKPYFSVAICVLPLVLWCGWREKGSWRILALLHIPLTIFLIYGKGEQPGLSASFGLASSAILLTGIWFLKRLTHRMAWITIIVILLAVACTALFIISNLPTPPLSETSRSTINFPDWHRQVIWGFTINIIEGSPILGVGPNTVNLVPGADDLIPGMNQEYIPSHPHNWVLEIAADTGILGVSALITTVLLGLKKLAVFVTREDPAPAWAAIALYSAFWTSSLGNFSIWSAWWLAVFAVLISFPLAAILTQHKSQAFHTK